MFQQGNVLFSPYIQFITTVITPNFISDTGVKKSGGYKVFSFLITSRREREIKKRANLSVLSSYLGYLGDFGGGGGGEVCCDTSVFFLVKSWF